MSTSFQYEHKIVIDAVRVDVIEDYLDYENYHEWQSSLKRVELIEGQYQQEHHLVHLIFDHAGPGDLVMAETILELSLPHKIVNRYQVGTTVNIQYNYFESFGAKTMWTVVTEFHFEQDPPVSEDVFKRTTKQGLLAFKRYVETR